MHRLSNYVMKNELQRSKYHQIVDIIRYWNRLVSLDLLEKCDFVVNLIRVAPKNNSKAGVREGWEILWEILFQHNFLLINFNLVD